MFTVTNMSTFVEVQNETNVKKVKGIVAARYLVFRKAHSIFLHAGSHDMLQFEMLNQSITCKNISINKEKL